MKIFDKYRELLVERLRTGDRNTLENMYVLSHIFLLFVGIVAYVFGDSVGSFVKKIAENGFDPLYLMIIVAYILGFLTILVAIRLMLLHIETFFEEIVAPNCKEADEQ